MKSRLLTVMASVLLSFLSMDVFAEEQAQVVTPSIKEAQSKESLKIYVVPTEDGVGFELPAGNPSYLEYESNDGTVRKETLAVKSLKIGEQYTQEINGIKIKLCPEVSNNSQEKQVRVTFQRPGSRDFVYLLKRTIGPNPSLTAAPVIAPPESANEK